MAATSKASSQLAKQLAKLSLGADGNVDPARVSGVLEYLQKHAPAQPLAVLRAYHRLVSIELAKSNAVVEHAGTISDAVLGSIAGALSQKYKRPINATARRNDNLLAGLRVHIADDVYESTVAGQLDALAASV